MKNFFEPVPYDTDCIVIIGFNHVLQIQLMCFILKKKNKRTKKSVVSGRIVQVPEYGLCRPVL